MSKPGKQRADRSHCRALGVGRERKRGASDSAFIGIEGGDPRVLHFHSLSIILKHKCGN